MFNILEIYWLLVMQIVQYLGNILAFGDAN